MSSQAGGGSDAQVPGLVYGGEDAPEVVRLRRENARLRHRLVAMQRERDDIVTRYEALLPDGAERAPGGGRTGTCECGMGERGTEGAGGNTRRADRGSLLAGIGRLLPSRLRR